MKKSSKFAWQNKGNVVSLQHKSNNKTNLSKIMREIYAKASEAEHKKIEIGPKGRKIYPEGTRFSHLKFVESDRTGLKVAFVSRNPVTGRLRGVSESEKCRKSVVVADGSISDRIKIGALYRVALVEMYGGRGYIAIDVEDMIYNAHVEINYIPRVSYSVHVVYGNRKITYMVNASEDSDMPGLEQVRHHIKTHEKIRNKKRVLADFNEAVADLTERYEKDGFKPTKSA